MWICFEMAGGGMLACVWFSCIRYVDARWVRMGRVQMVDNRTSNDELGNLMEGDEEAMKWWR